MGNIEVRIPMRIIKRATLEGFWRDKDYGDSKAPLEAWYGEAKRATWTSPQDAKDKYGTASIIANNRVVFNIKGNKYRLIVEIQYCAQIVWIKFLGTHKQYDDIEASTVDLY